MSVVFAMLRMLAFLVDQTQQVGGALCQAVWAQRGSKRLLWERMRALFYDDALTSMRPLCAALLYGFATSQRLMGSDASSGDACAAVPHVLALTPPPCRPKLRLHTMCNRLFPTPYATCPDKRYAQKRSRGSWVPSRHHFYGRIGKFYITSGNCWTNPFVPTGRSTTSVVSPTCCRASQPCNVWWLYC